MALNQIPYTNVHELNLDWILKKLKDFETELHAIEDYSPRINILESSVSSIRGSLQSIQHSLTELNKRCSGLEDALDSQRDTIEQIYVDFREYKSIIDAEIDSIVGQYITLKTYVDTNDSRVLRRSMQYTDDKFEELLDYILHISDVYVINPFTGQMDTLQAVLNYIADMMRWASITCSEFDAMGLDCDTLDCDTLDSIGYTCVDFDFYGKYALMQRDFVTQDQIANMVTTEMLEHYALLTDLEPLATKEDLLVYNPATGLKQSGQQVINTLFSYHQNGNNCHTLDGLGYTASEYDNTSFTAYEFDFIGLVRRYGEFINPLTGDRATAQHIFNSLATLHMHGISAGVFDSMNADCDTLDSLGYSAGEFDHFGISIFNTAGLISVVTGISAEQYQNILVNSDGSLFTII